VVGKDQFLGVRVKIDLLMDLVTDKKSAF